MPGLDVGLQIAIGGAHQAHVDAKGVGSAHRAHFPVLQDAQNLGLHLRPHVADLVEKQGPAIGGLEQAALGRDGAGEGPACVTKQLGFEQGLGQGGAIDRHEGLGRSRRALVDGACDQLLAGTRLAHYQHGRGRGGDACDQLVDIEHALALAFDVGDLALAATRGRRRVRFGGKAPALEGARHGQAELFDVEGLGHVVVGPVADGFHGAGDIAEGGDENDRRGRRFFGEGAQHVQPADPLHAHIRQDQIVASASRSLDGGRAVVHGFDIETLAAQDLAQQIARDRVVFDHQHSSHATPPVEILRVPDSSLGVPESPSPGPCSGR